MTKHTGSCLCGEVTFEIEGDFDALYLCHCSRCQKGTGSAHAANLFAPGATINWLTGAEQVKTYQVKETRHQRSFCTTCGAPMPNLQAGGKWLVVPAGCLDSALEITASAHLFTGSKAPWDVDLHTVASFDKLPTT